MRFFASSAVGYCCGDFVLVNGTLDSETAAVAVRGGRSFNGERRRPKCLFVVDT